MLNFLNFKCVSFDCYGTLIDWESGILGAFRPLVIRHGLTADDSTLLSLYSQIEPEIQAGEYKPYRQVLRETVVRIAENLGCTLNGDEADVLGNSLGNWQPFPDTVAALRRLQQHYKLAVISNIDDDLFAQTQRHLGVTFDFVITAQQAGSYKPLTQNFRLALRRIGLPVAEILHTAESVFHDVVPARSLGFSTVHVNRRGNRPGSGATRIVDAAPDLEVPDLKTLAEQVDAAFRQD